MNPFESGNPNDPQNQMMLISLSQIDEKNLALFLFQNSMLVEDDDKKIFSKSGINMLRNLTFIVIGGTFLNIQLKRIPKINFLQWHWLLRVPIRIPVFISPAAIIYKQIDDEMKRLYILHSKYFSRIIRTRRTGDLRYLDPSGILSKQFNDKMKNL